MNKYIRKAMISIEEIENVLRDVVCNNLQRDKKKSKIKVNILGEEVYALSDRYKTFFTKGYSCCQCGIKGKYFALEAGLGSKIPQYHLNLYAVNNENEEILMTKDHITPKSKGGINHLDNYQTMCCNCNAKKGSNIY